MADWNAIQAEYITTNTSYRKLGQKYGVHHTLIGQRSRQEGWRQARQAHREKTLNAILDADRDGRAALAKQLGSTAGKLLRKVDAVVEGIDPMETDPKHLKHISATLKDVKDVLMIRSQLDEQEQQARIDRLRQQANQEVPGQLSLLVEGLPEEFKA